MQPFEDRPALAVELLTALFDMHPPAWRRVEVESGNLTQVVPTVRHADLVIVLRDGDRPVWAVVIEVQLGKDDGKRLEVVDQERAEVYHDLVSAALPAAARRCLESLMSTTTYRLQSKYARKLVGRAAMQAREDGRSEGRATGRAEALLEILDARGVEVPDAARKRITGCEDLRQLNGWIRRAATAESIGDLFAG